jgi:hypothetical protein
MPIGNVAEEECSNRPNHDAEAVDADRGGNGGQTGQFEEDTAPHGRGNDAGDEEIVLFDHRADDARQRDFIDLACCGTRGGGGVHFLPRCQNFREFKSRPSF